MKLHQGMLAEYKKRHDEIWPELEALLKTVGVSDYSISFDEQTHLLFGQLKVSNPSALDLLPNEPVMKKWWAFMADIMETNPDHSPISTPLEEVFYLK